MGLRLLAALAAGSAIGYERSFHGRPAGFRTHALVCMASALLMLVTVYEGHWMRQTLAHVTLDPTRMAQGIMTGIGFLGAGVIMKDNLSIRGLTTAASIWITASIGILIGVGFYFAALVAAALTLGTLSLFRWIESVTPALHYGKIHLRFWRKDLLPENEVNALLARHHIDARHPIFRLVDEGKVFEYELTVRTKDSKNFRRAAESLTAMENVLEFQITPTGD